MPYASIGNARLFFTTSSRPGKHEHPALVLVHGAGGSRLHWPAELRRLAGATLHTVDLPGHGRSGGAVRTSVESYSEAAASFIASAGIAPAVIVGHSMRGAIGLALALRFEDVVAGLVLVATGARLCVSPRILRGISVNLPRAVDLMPRRNGHRAPRARWSSVGRQTLLETSPGVTLGDSAACDRFDVMDQIGEIGQPTLVVAGAADRLTPVKYARLRARGGNVVLIDRIEAGEISCDRCSSSGRRGSETPHWSACL